MSRPPSNQAYLVFFSAHSVWCEGLANARPHTLVVTSQGLLL
jgi:hypothetical protein